MYKLQKSTRAKVSFPRAIGLKTSILENIFTDMIGQVGAEEPKPASTWDVIENSTLLNP